MPTLVLNLHLWALSSHRLPPAISQEPLYWVTLSHVFCMLEERSLGV